jgi:hypothetical protein
MVYSITISIIGFLDFVHYPALPTEHSVLETVSVSVRWKGGEPLERAMT